VLALSAVLLDFAVQGNHVLSLRDIYSLCPQARARMNSVYMTCVFVGGAASSAVTGIVSQRWGWPGVTVFAAILAVAASLVWTGENAAMARRWPALVRAPGGGRPLVRGRPPVRGRPVAGGMSWPRRRRR